jgi:hypothetical protein
MPQTSTCGGEARRSVAARARAHYLSDQDGHDKGPQSIVKIAELAYRYDASGQQFVDTRRIPAQETQPIHREQPAPQCILRGIFKTLRVPVMGDEIHHFRDAG